MAKNLIPKICKMLGVELAKQEDEDVYIPGPFDADDESEEDTEE